MKEKRFIKKELNMKKLFRRNQIIITTLAVMIAVAGYLNYAGKEELAASGDQIYEAGMLEISDEDILGENQAANAELQDINSWDYDLEEAESYPELTSNQGEDVNSDSQPSGYANPGEAVLTSGQSVSEYIAGVQLSREQVRAKNKETLYQIINNTNIEESAKQQAIQNMIDLTAVAEKENAAETLLQAKGFADPVVSYSDGKVDVVVNAATISDQQRAQIEDIVKRKTEVGAEDIVITLLNLAE